MTDRQVIAATIVGAALGGLAGFLFFTDRGRMVRRQIEPALEDFVRDWEEDHLKWDANDLLAKIWTWQYGDIGGNQIYRGDFSRALQSIEARAIVMPCSTDMYFVPSNN